MELYAILIGVAGLVIATITAMWSKIGSLKNEVAVEKAKQVLAENVLLFKQAKKGAKDAEDAYNQTKDAFLKSNPDDSDTPA